MHLIATIILALSPPGQHSKSIAWTRDLVQTTSNNINFHIRGLNSKTNCQKFRNFKITTKILSSGRYGSGAQSPEIPYLALAVDRQPGHHREAS